MIKIFDCPLIFTSDEALSLTRTYREFKSPISIKRKFWVFTNCEASAYDREIVSKKIAELRKPIATCETFVTSELHHEYQVDGISFERFGYIGYNVTKNSEEDSLTIKLRFCTDDLNSTIIERELAPLGFTKEQE